MEAIDTINMFSQGRGMVANTLQHHKVREVIDHSAQSLIF